MRTRISHKQPVADELKSTTNGPGKSRRYRLRAVSLGGVLPDFDLDKAIRLADALEDEENARKSGRHR